MLLDALSDCPIVYKGRAKRSNGIRRATLRINAATKFLEGQVEGTVNDVWAWELEFADGTTKKISNIYGYQTEALPSKLASDVVGQGRGNGAHPESA